MSFFERALPLNYDAEQAVLGAVLMNNRAYDGVSEFLRPEHFADPTHGKIFAICQRLIDGGKVASPVTLVGYFKDDAGLEEIGGPGYLGQLANSCVSIINATDYGRLVYDLHMKRELISLGTGLVNQAYAQDNDAKSAEALLEDTEAQLFALSSSAVAENKEKTFGQSAAKAVEMAEAARKRGGIGGIATGLIDLDKKMGGLHPSDLLILAGRPSMGKTALATNIAFNVANSGIPAAFYSLEMSDDQLAARILSEQSEVASHKVRNGEMDDREFERYALASQRLADIPLYIDDTPALSVSGLRTRARRLKRQRNIGLVVVDYLQLMRGTSTKGDNRVQEVSEITRGLKALAKELGVPVIALSQLSRQVEQREDKKPQLSDLRESGSIEQDADVVMFVYREEYYVGRAEPSRRPDEAESKFNERLFNWNQQLQEVAGKAEVIIGKQRHGPIGSVDLSFQGDFTKFGNLYHGGR
jgi:replicative DNA helicase